MLHLLLCSVLVCGFAYRIQSWAADAPARPELDRDSHLVAWWKFDESSGKSVADSSGKNHSATLEGGLSFDANSVPGQSGKAILLDGKSSIAVAGFKGITGTRQRSVSLWLKTATGAGELISWGTRDAGHMFIFGHIRSRVGLTPKGGYLYMKAGTADDKWHHVAVVVREASPPNLHDDVSLYLDGKPAEIDDIGLLDLWPIDTGDQEDVRIGQRFKGAIDNLRIYDRALSEEEVLSLFKLESGQPVRP